MRRIAAVFAAKRSDRSDAASTAPSTRTDHSQHTTKSSSKKGFFRSISRKSKPVDPVVERLNSSDLQPPSSSSSSSGAPTTPDDDRRSLLRAPKAWLSQPADSKLGSFHTLDPSHDAARYAVAVSSRPLAASPSTLHTDTDDDISEDSFAPDLSNPPERSIPLPAPDYLLALTSRNLAPPFAPPPLLDVPGSPDYPRSSNYRRALHHRESLESSMHRARLQSRLQRSDLSPADVRAIAPFAGRRSAPRARPSMQLDDTAPRAGLVKPYSAGLRRWADRPCFEDRMHVLLAENVPPGYNGEPRWTRVVPATECGVAALEYSVPVEILAGFYEDLPKEHDTPPVHSPSPPPAPSFLDSLRLDTQLSLNFSLTSTHSPVETSPVSPTASSPTVVVTPQPAPTPIHSVKAGQPSGMPQPQPRTQSYKASPSPLRMEAVSASPPRPSAAGSPVSLVSPASVPTPTASAPEPLASPPASAPPVPLKSALKQQGVRFAEEEKDDGVPLGYVQRIKQKREEKARFLAAENERRKLDEERRRLDEERRRMDEQRRKHEEERARWEHEKRQMEEERRRRVYAEEVAAARSRRESQRYGFNASMTGEGLATGQWDRERSRADRDASVSSYARAAYDPAASPLRQHSDSSLALARPSRQGSASGSGSGSPGDSRPNSVYGSGSGTGSRPPSMHSGIPTPSSSQQDVRMRERRTSGSQNQSHRGSIASDSGSWRHSQALPMPPMPSMWNMNMAPVPMSALPMGMPMQQMQMQMQMPAMYAMGGAGGMNMGMGGMGVDMGMPLLPPSAPFMMQSYGPRRPSSQNSQRHAPQRSQSSSPTMTRSNLPASGSTERVNRLSSHAAGAGASPSPRAPSLPRSEASPHRSSHHRTASGEIPRRSAPASGNPRMHGDERRSPATPTSSSSGRRPVPTHSASMPVHAPPPTFKQARQSWAIPPNGFENLSRPAQGGKRPSVVS